jgi:arginase family enzyme
VDVLDPEEFHNSAFPVNDGISIKQFESLFDFCLKLKPEFVDLVEFGIKPSNSNSSQNPFKQIISWIEKSYVSVKNNRKK